MIDDFLGNMYADIVIRDLEKEIKYYKEKIDKQQETIDKLKALLKTSIEFIEVIDESSFDDYEDYRETRVEVNFFLNNPEIKKIRSVK